MSQRGGKCLVTAAARAPAGAQIVPWLRVRREICFVHNFVSFQ